MAKDRAFNRRLFFREGLRELLKPLSKAIAPLERAAQQFGKMEQPATPAPVQPPVDGGTSAGSSNWDPYGAQEETLLRPPGALPEDGFAAACTKCWECVNACPVQCIKIDSDYVRGQGLPYIDVDSMPCVLCSGLHCMSVCPTGALLPVEREEIDMGTAEVNLETCTHGHDGCIACVDHCPLGTVAIELHEEQVRVNEQGCVGCGVCQQHCPTMPKSIRVRARG